MVLRELGFQVISGGKRGIADSGRARGGKKFTKSIEKVGSEVRAKL